VTLEATRMPLPSIGRGGGATMTQLDLFPYPSDNPEQNLLHATHAYTRASVSHTCPVYGCACVEYLVLIPEVFPKVSNPE